MSILFFAYIFAILIINVVSNPVALTSDSGQKKNYGSSDKNDETGKDMILSGKKQIITDGKVLPDVVRIRTENVKEDQKRVIDNKKELATGGERKLDPTTKANDSIIHTKIINIFEEEGGIKQKNLFIDVRSSQKVKKNPKTKNVEGKGNMVKSHPTSVIKESAQSMKIKSYKNVTFPQSFVYVDGRVIVKGDKGQDGTDPGFIEFNDGISKTRISFGNVLKISIRRRNSSPGREVVVVYKKE